MSNPRTNQAVSAADSSSLSGPEGGSASANDGVDEASTQSGSSAPDNEQPLPLDVVYGILKNHRRRLVLRYLDEVSETSTLGELAEYIGSIENNKPVESLSSSERKRVYVGLYQGHLPRLDEADVIDFNSDRGTVVAGDNAEYLLEYLADDAEPTRNWSPYYLALAGIGGVAFVTQQLVYQSAFLSALVIGVMVGLFANMALEHAYRSQLVALPALFHREATSESS